MIKWHYSLEKRPNSIKFDLACYATVTVRSGFVYMKQFIDPFEFEADSDNSQYPYYDKLHSEDRRIVDDTTYGRELIEREKMTDSKIGGEIVAYRLAQKGHNMLLYHSHNCYELIFVLSEGRIVFSNTCGAIESNGRCVCFHNAHVLHRNNVPVDVFYDRVVIYCGVSALSMIGGGMGTLGKFENEGTVVIEFDNVMLSRMEYYLAELTKEDISLERKCLLTALILTELREYSDITNTRTLSPIRTYIKDVAEYIGKNYKQDISTPELAQHFFVSVNKLNRDFKRYMGTTIKQYLIALRMKYAQAMLASGEGVRKTAEECGFDSLSYFIQAFRQYTGKTPSAFAKKALGKFDYYT